MNDETNVNAADAAPATEGVVTDVAEAHNEALAINEGRIEEEQPALATEAAQPEQDEPSLATEEQKALPEGEQEQIEQE